MENTFATCDKYINYYINLSLLFYGIFRVLTYYTWEYEDALQNLIIQPSLHFFFFWVIQYLQQGRGQGD